MRFSARSFWDERILCASAKVTPDFFDTVPLMGRHCAVCWRSQLMNRSGDELRICMLWRRIYALNGAVLRVVNRLYNFQESSLSSALERRQIRGLRACI